MCVFSIVSVPLDPVGNVSLALEIVILFLLILGLPLVRSRDNRRNLVWHGYLTTIAVALHTVLIIIVMIPVFTGGFGELTGLSLFYSVTVWSHEVFGIMAEILGVFLVMSWLSRGTSRMTCMKRKKWMLPTFIIWTVAIVNGALVHILGML